MEFLLSLSRINMAVSREKGLALVLQAPHLYRAKCDTVEKNAAEQYTLCFKRLDVLIDVARS